MVEQGIDRKALDFLTSPNPDFEWLRRYPSRAAGKDWREVEPMARRFVHDHRTAWDSPSLVIRGTQVPFLKVEFPYAGTRLSLMSTKGNLVVTDSEYLATDLLVERGSKLSLEIWPQNLVLGSDAWRDQEGHRIWFVVPTQGRQVNRPLVNCVRTVVALGEEYFAMQNHVPTPS